MLFYLVDVRINDKKKKWVCFDDDLFHLKKDYVNKEEGYYKGIQLSGVSSMREEIKLYVSYYDEKNDKIELFLEVSDEIR